MRVLSIKRLTAALAIFLWAAGIVLAAPAPTAMSPVPQSIGLDQIYSMIGVEQFDVRAMSNAAWTYNPGFSESEHPIPDSLVILLTGGGLFAMAFIIRRQRTGLLS